MAIPKVVFPEPLSPTTPSVSPSLILNVTPLTALIYPIVLFKIPFCMGNQTLKSFTSRIGLASLLIGGGSPVGSEFINFRVYSVLGLANRFVTLLVSTILPSIITATLSATFFTMLKSWVISKIAIPNFFCSCFRRFKICACTVTSRAVVGSSAINKSGWFANAIAIITRCLCPPES